MRVGGSEGNMEAKMRMRVRMKGLGELGKGGVIVGVREGSI